MGNVGLGGSKRQSYSPGQVTVGGQAAAAAPENGNAKPGANGQAEAVTDDVTERRDVTAAEDGSGVTSSAPGTPTSASPASPVSPTEKKSKRRVPRFVFSLRRTGSGKRSRKPRTEANGVRPVSYPIAAAGAPGSNLSAVEDKKGRPQSLLFEEITIPEDDGRIETVSLSSSDENLDKDSKTSASKKEKKKEGSQKKKSSQKKKDKEKDKPKTDKQKKGTKDKEDTEAVSSEPPKAVEEKMTSLVASAEESVQAKQPSKSDVPVQEEIIVATVAKTKASQPFKLFEDETQPVQEVMVVEVAKASEQTPEPVAVVESGLSEEANQDPTEFKSGDAELKESSSTEDKTQIHREEVKQEDEIGAKQEEKPENNKPENASKPEDDKQANENKVEEEQREENKTSEDEREEEKTEEKKEDQPEATKTEEDKPEEAETAVISAEDSKSDESKPNEIVSSQTDIVVEESKDKENVSKETGIVEAPIVMIIEKSVAAVAHSEMTLEKENTPESESTKLTAESSDAVQTEAKAEHQNSPDESPDFRTTLDDVTVEEHKGEEKPTVVEVEVTKDTTDESIATDEQPTERVNTNVTPVAPVRTKHIRSSAALKVAERPAEGTAESTETKDSSCQEATEQSDTQDRDDVSQSKTADTDKAVVVEEVVLQSVDTQVQAVVQVVSPQPTAESAPEQGKTPDQPAVVKENEDGEPENETVNKTEQPRREEGEEAAEVDKQVAEDVAASPVTAQPPPTSAAGGDTQPTDENPPPLSPSQIKALEKERRAAKKKEEKEKAKKEKEEKKRQKEQKRQEAKDKKQKDREERDRKTRELREKGKVPVGVGVEDKQEETTQEDATAANDNITESAPVSSVRAEVKPEEPEASSSATTVLDSAPASPISTETKQEETKAPASDTRGTEAKTEAPSSPETEALKTAAPSTESVDPKSSQVTKTEKSINVEQQLTDTEPPATEELDRPPTSLTGSVSSESACSGPFSPATPDSPLTDPTSPDISADSTPTSPLSPEAGEAGRPGGLKKIELGPRLRTAILRKSSSGAESEEKRVSLTQPRFVQVSELTPPPRKKRPRRPVEQVWSPPPGDRASNVETKSPTRKEAVVEELATASRASSSESAPAEAPVPQAENQTVEGDASVSQKAELEQSQPRSEAAAAPISDTDAPSTSFSQKAESEEKASTVEKVEVEVEQSLMAAVAPSVESVPGTDVVQSTADAVTRGDGPQKSEVMRIGQKAAFVFETPPVVSPSAVTDNGQDREVTSTARVDNDSEYKVMCDLPSSGSRVSIHSDPSSPTVVSVASIVLSGQPEVPDAFPDPSPPAPELQEASNAQRPLVAEKQAEEVEENAEDKVHREEVISVPQETAGLQTMAAGLVSQASEDAQEEVIKLISVDKVDENDEHTDDQTEAKVSECPVSEKQDNQERVTEKIVETSSDALTEMSCQKREQEIDETIPDQEHSAMNGTDISDKACDDGDTLDVNCENKIYEQIEVRQAAAVCAAKDSAKTMSDDTVTVASQPFVSVSCSALVESQSSDTTGADVIVSNRQTEGASIDVDNSLAKDSAECVPSVSDFTEESDSSSQLESIKTTVLLHSSAEFPSGSKVTVSTEEDENTLQENTGTSYVAASAELGAPVNIEVKNACGEQSADSEFKDEVENVVKTEMEETVTEPSEDFESKTTTESSATPSMLEHKDAVDKDTSEVDCSNKTVHDITAVVETGLAEQESDKVVESIAQPSSTPEKESGEAEQDKQFSETNPEHPEDSHDKESKDASQESFTETHTKQTDQRGQVNQDDEEDASPETSEESNINNLNIPVSAVSVEVTVGDVENGEQHSNSDHRPEDVRDARMKITVDEETKQNSDERVELAVDKEMKEDHEEQKAKAVEGQADEVHDGQVKAAEEKETKDAHEDQTNRVDEERTEELHDGQTKYVVDKETEDIHDGLMKRVDEEQEEDVRDKTEDNQGEQLKHVEEEANEVHDAQIKPLTKEETNDAHDGQIESAVDGEAEEQLNGQLKQPEDEEEAKEVPVPAHCNGSHVPEANSCDTIDAYLRLQDGAEQVHKAAHAEKLQDNDPTGARTADSTTEETTANAAGDHASND